MILKYILKPLNAKKYCNKLLVLKGLVSFQNIALGSDGEAEQRTGGGGCCIREDQGRGRGGRQGRGEAGEMVTLLSKRGEIQK